jgi:RNA polymerase sigma-B factor
MDLGPVQLCEKEAAMTTIARELAPSERIYALSQAEQAARVALVEQGARAALAERAAREQSAGPGTTEPPAPSQDAMSPGIDQHVREKAERAARALQAQGVDLAERGRRRAQQQLADSRAAGLIRLAAMDGNDPGRPALRRSVVEEHLPLVHHLAQRFKGRGEPYDDIVQVGTIGLMNAVDRYEPSRGSFTTFAVPTIVGEIRRHFRDRGWAMRIPRRVQDLGRRVSQAREALTQEFGRSPTVDEIAKVLEVDPDLVLEALETAAAYITVPLPAMADETAIGARPLPNFESEQDAELELVEQREMLRPLLKQLPVREQRILELRFGRGMTQSRIAAEVGLSQMHVSRLLAKSLVTLRRELTESS